MKKFTGKAWTVIAASLMLLFAVPFVSMAAGPVVGIPTVVKPAQSPTQPDLDTVVANAGLGALGNCNIAPDPVLGIVPMVYYVFKNPAGTDLGNGVASTTTEYLYNKDGFSKFYMDHAGMARLYYRVYTDATGWSPWCNSREMTPGNDNGEKVQAIQIRVKGYTRTLADLYYKVVLSDGTVLDWASNGQITGAVGNDRYIVALAITLWDKNQGFPAATQKLLCAQNYEGCFRSPDGKVHYSTADGHAHTGWGWLDQTQYYFMNGEPATGWQYVDGYKYYFNNDGSICRDLEPLMGLPGNYNLRYNKSTKTMYVMALDEATGQYIIPYKTFMSSCGPDTPLGTYKTYVKYDWKYMHDSGDGSGDIFCQKLTRFYQGFLIHSLLYYRQASPFTLDAINYNYIDNAASGGCIRMRACDANWIYTNIPLQTPITIYENMYEKGPVEKDAIEQAIPKDQNYDPTDPEALAALAAAGNADGQALVASTTHEAVDDRQ